MRIGYFRVPDLPPPAHLVSTPVGQMQSGASTLQTPDNLQILSTISPLPRYQPPPSLWQRIKGTFKNLGSSLNQPVMNYFSGFHDKATHKAIVNLAEDAMRQGLPLKTVEQMAIQATAQHHGQWLQPAELAATAYESLMAAALHVDYSDPGFFQGEKDKIFHYFTSAALTARAHEHLPFAAQHNSKLAFNIVHSLGWLKERFSVPFSPEDMQANDLGANAALQTIQQLRFKQQMVSG